MLSSNKTYTSIAITLAIIIIVNIISCTSEYGQVVISQPDEYIRNYEAKETVILKAIALVFSEKKVGNNIKINPHNLTVDSDYIIQGDWRTKSRAMVRRLNWKECEVILSVTTEKKTNAGWEMRRLLSKDQYDVFFSTIELKIYEEMSKLN